MVVDAGKMTKKHAHTMERRLVVKGVVRVQCDNPDDHDKEPYARFYWNMRTVLKKHGMRPTSKLVGGEHVVTIVPDDETRREILDWLEKNGR